MSLLTPHHESQGARPSGPGAPLPILTHSSPPAEYQAATQTWALFDRGPRGLVHVTGKDAPAFFTRIISCDVRRLEPGQGTRGMLLTSKGKVQELFDLTRTTEGFDLTLPPDRAESLIGGLDMYHFGEELKFSDQSGTRITFDAVGPKAQAALAQAFHVDVPEAPHTSIQVEHQGLPWRLTAQPIAGIPGFRLEGPLQATPDPTGPGQALWSALLQAGATPAGLVAFDSLRAENAAGLWAADIDDSIYPQEARLEDAFSLDKGCYIGQEVVAKIDTYGGLNKRLMLLEVQDDDPVPPRHPPHAARPRPRKAPARPGRHHHLGLLLRAATGASASPTSNANTKHPAPPSTWAKPAAPPSCKTANRYFSVVRAPNACSPGASLLRPR